MTTTTQPASGAPTASHMIDLLRRHYLPDHRRAGGIFATEIADPEGRRRADLIWLGATSASGYELIGHEIKVSRADLAAELADLTKSDPWQRLCDRWWLVVPSAALIDGLELPVTWGVLAPPSGRRSRSMTVLREAPSLSPHDQAAAYKTLATWVHWRREDARQAAEQARTETDHARERMRIAEARAPREDYPASRLHDVVEQIVTRLGGPSRHSDGAVGEFRHEVPVDAVVTALRDFGALRREARHLRTALASRLVELRRLLDVVDRDELERLDSALAEMDEHQRAAGPA